MSYLAQFTTARQAARTEEKRQATQLAEARRAERLDVIREFIQLTQEGIRLAEDRYEAPDWTSGGTPGGSPPRVPSSNASGSASG